MTTEEIGEQLAKLIIPFVKNPVRGIDTPEFRKIRVDESDQFLNSLYKITQQIWKEQDATVSRSA